MLSQSHVNAAVGKGRHDRGFLSMAQDSTGFSNSCVALKIVEEPAALSEEMERNC